MSIEEQLKKYIKHYYCEDSYYNCSALGGYEVDFGVIDENRCDCGRNEAIVDLSKAIQSYIKSKIPEEIEVIDGFQLDYDEGWNAARAELMKNLGVSDEI